MKDFTQYMDRFINEVVLEDANWWILYWSRDQPTKFGYLRTAADSLSFG